MFEQKIKVVVKGCAQKMPSMCVVHFETGFKQFLIVIVGTAGFIC